MRNTGRTQEDITSLATAKMLVAALERIECFNGDPEMILDDAQGQARGKRDGVMGAVIALRRHYCGHEDSEA